MKALKIKGFEWDSGNAGHIRARHGLTSDEVEEVFLGEPLIRRLGEERVAAYGQDDGILQWFTFARTPV